MLLVGICVQNTSDFLFSSPFPSFATSCHPSLDALPPFFWYVFEVCNIYISSMEFAHVHNTSQLLFLILYPFPRPLNPLSLCEIPFPCFLFSVFYIALHFYRVVYVREMMWCLSLYATFISLNIVHPFSNK